jgi:tRNA (guanine37-N1)-methyltransferase
MLDRSAFSSTLQLVALRIPARRCQAFMQRLQSHAFSRPKLRPIVPDTTAEMKLFLLSEQVKDLDLAELPAEMRDFVVAEGVERLHHPVHISYEYFSAEAVLRKLLPEGLEVPSSFEQVGHIAHLNLRKEHLPYKELIGQARAAARGPAARAAARTPSRARAQVLLDKNTPRIRTILNKVDTISNEFRVFPMEVLA